MSQLALNYLIAAGPWQIALRADSTYRAIEWATHSEDTTILARMPCTFVRYCHRWRLHELKTTFLTVSGLVIGRLQKADDFFTWLNALSGPSLGQRLAREFPRRLRLRKGKSQSSGNPRTFVQELRLLIFDARGALLFHG